VHKSIAVVAFASIAVLLAACQGPSTDTTDQLACQPVEAGEASDAIQVRGPELEEPRVNFPESLDAARTQRTVIDPGNGRLAEVGSLVTFAYAAFNGNTGEPIDVVGYETPRSQATLDRSSLVAGFEDALLCSHAGARIAAVIPPTDAFGDAGNERYGIGASDSVVLVVDLIAVAADRATGEPQPVIDSLPGVHVAATGEPQVSIPPSAPPAGFSATVLKKGGGDVVADGATVTVEYVGVIWGSGRTFDSSWPRQELVRMPTSNFLKGFGDALVGQTVGSQVLAILPPHTAYGEPGNPSMGIDANDTIVFVIDILAAVAPPAAAGQE
jgi:FKBP-type peptidyl-prolyl cis-trans isomerase